MDPKDQQAGYAPRLSIWQMEFSLTQVFDRPVHLKNLPHLKQIARNINPRLWEVERFICRQAGSTRYEFIPYGRYTSLFLVRPCQRVLRPGLAAAVEPPWKVDVPHPLRHKIQELDAVLERMLRDAHIHN